MTYTETLVDLSVLQNLLTSEFSSVKTRKCVSFCRQLEKVRYFRTEDPVLNIRTQQEQAKTHLPQYLMRSSVASRYLSAEFLAGQVRDRCVVLEYVVLRYPFFEGYVSVKNLSFQKRVVIRYTVDNWRSTGEVVARFDSSNHSTNADRFVFTIDATPFYSGPVDLTMLFAVRFEGAGQEFWDNNGGLNYRADFVKLPAPIAAFAPSALSSSPSKSSTPVPPSPTTLPFSSSPSSTPSPLNLSTSTLSSSPSASSPFSDAMSPLAASAAAVVAQLEAEPGKLLSVSRSPSSSYILTFTPSTAIDTKSRGASSSSSSSISSPSSSPSSSAFSPVPSPAALRPISPSSSTPTITTTSSLHRPAPATQPINIAKRRVLTNPGWWADEASSSSSSSSPSAITSASSASSSSSSSSSSSPPKSDLGHAYLTVSLAHNPSSFWQ